MRRAQGGDVRAFEELIERYFAMVHSIAYVRLKHRETAEDLAQEVFLRVFLHLDTIRDPKRFAAWIGQIARNLAFHWQRDNRRASSLLPMVALDELPREVPDPRQEEARRSMEEQDKVRLVREAIFRLSPEEAEVVLLKFGEELGTDEIAQRLGVHPTTVRRHLNKALEAMKGTLEPMLGEIAPHLLPPREAAIRTIRLVGAVAILSPAAKAPLISASASAGKLWIAGLTLRTVYWWAYKTLPARVVMPPDLAQTRYDISLETTQADLEALYPALQEVLFRQFGLSARRETRESDVYILTVPEGGPPAGLRPPGGTLIFMKLDNRCGSRCQNSQLDCLVIDLEDNLERPVIDETGLGERYDWDLQWDPTDGAEGIIRAVREQLGLGLTPARRPVEMLVLEKAAD